MDNVYLVLPSKEHEQSYINMMTEWENTGEHIYPGAIRSNGMNYSDWLNKVKSYTHKETCPSHLVPSDTYFLINDNGKILGAISIRYYLNENLLSTGGHIGYGIRPTERRKGYAKAMLKMALEKCIQLDIKKALITCDKTNIASAKTILANGGILENEVVEDNGNVVQRYCKIFR
jgi:predicted acetyltransferase